MGWDSERYRRWVEQRELWLIEEDQIEELSEEEQQRLQRSMRWHPSRGPHNGTHE
jgi:ABC-type transport system involved in cytochrome c biogenesis ATPase subunit